MFIYDDQGYDAQADLKDYGNLDTSLQPCRRSIPTALYDAINAILETPDVAAVTLSDGDLGLRVNGLEFARTTATELLFGVHRKRVARPNHLGEIVALAQQSADLHSAEAADRRTPLYLANPEAWLESQVRAQIEEVDAQLLPEPIYGHVPSFATIDRGMLDLLAVDRAGGLSVIELKASQDIHLPPQALDYWMRVKWHVDRAECNARGYFQGIELNSAPPRLLLALARARHPSLQRTHSPFSFHPPFQSNESAWAYNGGRS